MMMNYQEFLTSKMKPAKALGFEVDPAKLPGFLFPFQRDVVARALKMGRYALFEDCGLGKSGQELAWADAVCRHTGGQVLCFAPLAVAQQLVTEGAKFGIPCRYVKDEAEAMQAVLDGINIHITNYERLEKFNVSAYAGVVCDESSILKAFQGKTKKALIDAVKPVNYRLAATATPSPNDVMELLNHAEFLGVMKPTMALTRWFINDQANAGNYRLKKHAEADFWQWVASWAVCIAKPSDLGPQYSDEGYDLPTLRIREHIVKVDHDSAEGTLFRMPEMNATGLSRELRHTLSARCARAAEIVRAEPDEPWVIWCNLNDEATELNRLLPEAVEVRGSMTPEQKEAGLLGFARGEHRILVTKSEIAGFGLNYQHCARHIFVGMNYSYEAFYQAVRRSYRFGQTREVEAHLVIAETETSVKDTVGRKAGEHIVMQEKMIEAMRQTGLENERHVAELEVSEGYVKTEEGRDWTLHLGDCVEVAQKKIEPDSIGLIVSSLPFSNLYTYSANLRDMGNTENDAHFFQHFSYLVPEMLRVLMPGRKVAMHVQDLVMYKTTHGVSGLRDFSGDVIRAMQDYTAPDGSRFVLSGKITIWKSPVTEMHRTNAHRLLYKTLRTDASYTDVGRPDYLLTFRKWTPGIDSAEPITHTKEGFPLDQWQEWASPVWMDIDQMNVLNHKLAKSDRDEKHICPLQLDLIARCIELWSNPGDVVYDPFMGVGSVGFEAIKAKRKALGSELKLEYFDHAVKNMKAAEDVPESLFDFLTAEASD